MDGRQLRALFKRFNDQYWGGRLPAYSIRAVAEITSRGTWGECRKEKRVIKVLRKLPEKPATSTLLHEMAHAATNGHHGKVWKREMIRLREAGAPLAGFDRIIRLEQEMEQRITKKRFRLATRDLLMEAPDAPLSDAIRSFFSTEGGPKTIAAFLRKYQWARAVFNEEKKEGAEEEKRKIAFFAIGSVK
jgi:SprT-like family